MSSFRVEVRAAVKHFGQTRALDGVGLQARAGRVHAVLGENGAGKSTLMNILAGVFAPDEGQLLVDAEDYLPKDPMAARRAGVQIVHQEPQLCDHLTIEQNMVLGAEPERRGWLDREVGRQQARSALEFLLGSDAARAICLDAPVSDVGPGTRQIVAIARAIASKDCRVLILDEPTSSLSRAEVEQLFSSLRRLKEGGLCILYISHFLEDVMRIADDYTVLRDGKSVQEGAVEDATIDDWVRAMVGRNVNDLYPRSERDALEPIVELDNVWTHRGGPSSLTVRRGQVVGIAGLVGSGRTELLEAIFGLSNIVKGRVKVAGFDGRATPARRLAQGVGMLSEDRQGQGLCLSMSIQDNILLSRLPVWLRPARCREDAEHWTQALRVSCEDVEQEVGQLSGGNQQKVALARLLHHDVDVFVLDEPTRGIDVGSRAQIYRRIDELACNGKAVILVSSYLPEVLGICDRVAVMRQGRLGPLHRVQDVDAESLLREATVAA